MTTRTRFSARRAFTLVELLVVIAIIGTLIGLLLPAIQMVKEAARRTQCASQMRQVAIACNTYQTMHNSFPPGVPSCMATPAFGATVQNLGASSGAYCQGPNWLSALLEQLEEKPMSDNLRLCLAHKWNACDECAAAGQEGADTWSGVGDPIPNTLICPSAPDVFGPLSNTATNVGLSGMKKGNYAGCFGSQYYLPEDDTANRVPPFYNNPNVKRAQKAGVFEHITLPPAGSPAHLATAKNDPSFKPRGPKMGHNLGTTIAAIKDGPSKTIMVSEVLAYESPADGRGAWTVGAMGCSGFTANFPPNDPTLDQIPVCDTSITSPLKMKCTQNATTRAFALARSGHSGGVNASTADANTRFISDTIDVGVWQALCTKYGGEPEQLP